MAFTYDYYIRQEVPDALVGSHHYWVQDLTNFPDKGGYWSIFYSGASTWLGRSLARQMARRLRERGYTKAVVVRRRRSVVGLLVSDQLDHWRQRAWDAEKALREKEGNHNDV